MILKIGSKLMVTGILIITMVLTLRAQNLNIWSIEKECKIRKGLPNLGLKLEQNRKVTIAYLGGSITAAKDGWREKSLRWIRENYTDSVIAVNAALPGTGSDLGAFRLRQHVLNADPDLVFIEFAVNDGRKSSTLIRETMEGIVRQIRKNNKRTEICFVYTISGEMLNLMQQGGLPKSINAMEEVAEFYGIPSINMGLTVADQEAKGTLVFGGKKEDFKDKRVFSPDRIHPFSDTGHEIYAEVMARSLNVLLGYARKKLVNYPIGKPMSVNNWEFAQMIPLQELKKDGGWTKVIDPENELKIRLMGTNRDVFKSNFARASITVTFKGSRIGLYDVIGPGSGQYDILVDGLPAKTIQRFDKNCTYYRINYFMLPELKYGKHTVVFKVSEEKLNKFEILKEMNGKMSSTLNAEYAENAGYAIGLLLNGQIL